MVPFFDFCWPCVSGYAEWGDNEGLVDLVGVVYEVVDGGEGDDGFSHAHAEEYGCLVVGSDVVDGVLLVVMWFVFH